MSAIGLLLASCLIGAIGVIYAWFKYGTVEEEPREYHDFTKGAPEPAAKKKRRKGKKGGGMKPKPKVNLTGKKKARKITGAKRCESMHTILRGHQNEPKIMHWQQDSKMIMTMDSEGYIRLFWNFEGRDSAGTQHTFKPEGAFATCATLYPGNKIGVVDALNSKFLVYKYTLKKTKAVIEKVESSNLAHCPLAKGNTWPQIVCGAKSDRIWNLIWDPSRGSGDTITLHDQWLNEVGRKKISQWQNYMVGKNFDSTLGFLTTTTCCNVFLIKKVGKNRLEKLPKTGQLKGNGDVRYAAFSPQSKYLALACKSGMAVVYKADIRWHDHEASTKLFEVQCCESQLDSVAISDDGILCVSYQNFLRFFDAKTGKQLDEATNCTRDTASRVNHMKQSPDGKWIATIGSDKNLKIWQFPKA